MAFGIGIPTFCKVKSSGLLALIFHLVLIFYLNIMKINKLKNKINFLTIIWILFYIFIFFFLLNNSYGYLDPDLGWHLKIGEDIIKEKQVPNINYYNYTLEGKTWVDHEWLMDAFTFWLYNNFGYLAVNIFFVFIIIAALIILNIFVIKNFIKNISGTVIIIFFQTLGIIAMAPHLGVRLQEITLLNIVILLIILHYYNKNKSYKILFLLFPLFYLWACVHAGFLIGIFILFFWLGVKVVEKILNKFNKNNKIIKIIDFNSILNRKNLLILAIFSLIAVGLTILTPYKLKLFSFLSEYRDTFYMSHIQEWLGQNYFPFNYWQLIYLALVATAVLLTIFFSIKGKDNFFKINLWQILMAVFFIFLAFKSRRHFPLLFIVSFPFTVSMFAYFLRLPENSALKSSLVKKICFLYFAISVIMLGIFKISTTRFTLTPFNSFCNFYPCEAVDFLKENSKYNNLNIFNYYGWCGYLIWVLPERKLFIDGRLPQYEFAGHTIMKEYYEFFKKEKAEEKLSQYNIQLVLLNTRKNKYKVNWFEKYFFGIDEEKLNNQKNNLKEYLDNSNYWDMVYSDNVGNIYLKNYGIIKKESI